MLALPASTPASGCSRRRRGASNRAVRSRSAADRPRRRRGQRLRGARWADALARPATSSRPTAGQAAQRSAARTSPPGAARSTPLRLLEDVPRLGRGVIRRRRGGRCTSTSTTRRPDADTDMNVVPAGDGPRRGAGRRPSASRYARETLDELLGLATWASARSRGCRRGRGAPSCRSARDPLLAEPAQGRGSRRCFRLDAQPSPSAATNTT